MPNKAEPNRLIVKFPIKAFDTITLFTNSGNYDVWDTDYTTYSLVYSCQNYASLIKYENAWILSRTQSLPDEKINQLKNILQQKKVDISKFVKTDQTSC